MHKLYLCLVVLVFLPQALRPQFIEKQVNQDSLTPVLRRMQPRLLPVAGGGFLVHWRESGNTVLPMAAQLFSASLSKTGTNFLLQGDEAVSATPSGDVLCISMVSSEVWPSTTCFDFFSSVRNINGTYSAPIGFTRAAIGECATGWLRYQHSAMADRNTFLISGQGDGNAMYRRISSTGDTIRTIKQFRGNTGVTKPAVLPAGRGHMLAWLHANYGYWNDTLPPGLYGSFYSSADNTLRDSVLLFRYYSASGMAPHPAYSVIPVQDSLYRVYVCHPDSLQLYTALLSASGSIMGSLDSISLRRNFPWQNLQRMDIAMATGPMAGKSLMLLSAGGIPKALYVPLDALGKPLVPSAPATSRGYLPSAYYFQSTAADVYYPIQTNGDVFLGHFIDSVLTETIPVGDTPVVLAGSNDVVPGITALTTTPNARDGFFVTWSSNGVPYGRFCRADGTPAGAQRRLNTVFAGALPNKKTALFDRSFLGADSLFINVIDTTFAKSYGQLITTDFTITGKEQLVRQSDTSFVVALRQQQGTGIFRFNAQGKKTGYLLVPGQDSSRTTPKVCVTEAGALWLLTGNKAIKTDALLQQVITTLPLRLAAYLGGGVLLKISPEQGLTGTLINESGAVIADNISYGGSSNSWSVLAQPGAFAVLYVANGVLEARAASAVTGLPTLPPVALHGNTPFARANYTAALNPLNGQMAVVYQEDHGVAWQNEIYIATGTFSQITDVAEQQAPGVPGRGMCTVYPNPARHYASVAIPGNGAFRPYSLFVYSVHGEKTDITSSGFLPPEGSVTALPLHGLSSGVYIIELRFGKEILRTKLLICR